MRIIAFLAALSACVMLGGCFFFHHNQAVVSETLPPASGRLRRGFFLSLLPIEWLGPVRTLFAASLCWAAALQLSNGLTVNLWDHSEARQMKFFIATFSLLVLLALSGSMVALLVGVSGYLPDVGAGTQAASAKSTSRLR